MTQYVQESEQDPALYLVKFFNEVAGNDPQVNASELALVGSEQLPGETLKQRDSRCYSKLVNRYLPQLGKLKGKDPTQIQTIYGLIFSLLQLIKQDHGIKHILKALADSLARNHDDIPEQAIKLLTNLFNLVHDQNPVRASVFDSILEVALRPGNSDLLIALFKGRLSAAGTWIKEWMALSGVTRELANSLLLKCALANERCGDLPAAFALRLTFLRQASPESYNSRQTVQTAIEVAQHCIREKKHLDVDAVLELGPIQNLATSHQRLHHLLRIVAGLKYCELATFIKQNPTFLQENGFDQSQLESKLRTLTLCTLGLDQEVLSYDVLREELQVDSDVAVETIVIESVRSGFLDAKINEKLRQITIHRTVSRTFQGRKSWQALSGKLEAWRENTRNVLHLLHQVRRQAMAQLQAQQEADQRAAA